MSTHSLKIVKSCIFFFPKTKKKKNTALFFFFPEKVYLHSLNFFGGGHIKNKLKKPYFSKSGSFNPKYVVFFFLPCSVFFLHVFFFSCKSLSLTHSLISNLVFFFSPGTGKKNTVFLLTHTILLKMSQK